MDLERTRRLLTTEPSTAQPLALLVEVLAAAIELLSVEENDFVWSPWSSRSDAIAEIEPLLRQAESGTVPEHAKLWVLFAPTGPIQEVSMSSGWGEAFLKLAERYDTAEDLLWPPPSGSRATAPRRANKPLQPTSGDHPSGKGGTLLAPLAAVRQR